MNSTRQCLSAFVFSAITTAAFLATACANAQDANQTSPPQFATPPSFTDAWEFQVGGGLISRPEYPGSDDNKVEFLPIVSATYGRYFFGASPVAGSPVGLGAYLYQDGNWRIGIAIGRGFSKLREESDDSRLRGLGDVDATLRGRLFASYTFNWLTLRGNVSQDLGGDDQGTLASLDVEGKYGLNRNLTLTAGPGLTWASSDYTQTLFGINATQSARSGRASFNADSGINSVRFSLAADYRLTPKWQLSARLTAARLRGSAADSPITQDKSQNTIGAFAAYRF